jgi:hypothetical protein
MGNRGRSAHTFTVWLYVGGALLVIGLVAVVLQFSAALPFLAAAVAGVMIAMLGKKSIAHAVVLGAVSFIAIPLIPGLQEFRLPQIAALSAVALILLIGVLSTARKRGVTNRIAIWAAMVPIALSAVTVGVLSFNDMRLLVGVFTGLLLGLGIAAGKTASRAETSSIASGFTAIAVVTAVIALVEAARGTPLYEFTTFQSSENAQVAFRASSLFGHPLVLSVFMLFVALINMSRPKGNYPWWVRYRLVSVWLPLAAAAATVSRSAIVVLAVGIMAIVAARRDSDVTHVRRGWAVIIGAGAAMFIWLALADPNGGFAQRFGSLSVTEQSVRTNALATAQAITSGIETVIGGGPRAVAAAFVVRDDAVRFGTLDNQFITAYTDFGLIGFVGIVLLSLRMLNALRSIRVNSWKRSVVVGGFAPLTAMFFLEPLAWPAIGLLFALAVGAALDRTAESPVKPHTVPAMTSLRR